MFRLERVVNIILMIIVLMFLGMPFLVILMSVGLVLLLYFVYKKTKEKWDKCENEKKYVYYSNVKKWRKGHSFFLGRCTYCGMPKRYADWFFQASLI